MLATTGKNIIKGLMGRNGRPLPFPKDEKGMDGLYSGNLIRTWSGVLIDVFDPNPNDIVIEDIAHGLAMRCRFGGHTQSFHTVAEHCIHICDMVPDRLKMQALLHDASEAYIGDMPTPIKKNLPVFLRLEMRLMERIGERFGFDPHLDPMVKALDKSSLEWEWEHKVVEDKVQSLSPERVKALFLQRFYDIYKHY